MNSVPPLVNIQPEQVVNIQPAPTAWVLFFSLVLFFELMVVMVKLVFGETVDDRIDMMREQASQFKASAYLEAMTSPVAGTRRLLDETYA